MVHLEGSQCHCHPVVHLTSLQQHTGYSSQSSLLCRLITHCHSQSILFHTPPAAPASPLSHLPCVRYLSHVLLPVLLQLIQFCPADCWHRALSWGPVPPAHPEADFYQKSKSCRKHLLLREAFPGQTAHHPPPLITSCGFCLHIFFSIPIICHMCTYKVPSTKPAGNKNSGFHVTEKAQSARHNSKHFGSHNHPIKQGRV